MYIDCNHPVRKELGPVALSYETSWFVITLLRSHIVRKEVQDGVAQLTRLVFSAFCDAAGGDMRHGISLTFHGGQRAMLLCNCAVLLGDEGALKETLGVKGAAGTLVCSLCANVVGINSDLAGRAGSLVDHAEFDLKQWILHTDDSLVANQKHLCAQHGSGTKESFKVMQQALGMNYCPLGLLASEPVVTFGFCPSTGIMYDWMHCYLVAGLFHHEARPSWDRRSRSLPLSIGLYIYGFAQPSQLRHDSTCSIRPHVNIHCCCRAFYFRSVCTHQRMRHACCVRNTCLHVRH